MKNYLLTPEHFVTLSHRLLEEVKKRGCAYKGILCPLRGGFFLSYFMSRHLKLPMYYLEISSYSGKEQLEFQIGLKPDLAEGYFLLCDDIYDSGNTVRKIHDIYPHVDFDTVCLISKSNAPDIITGEMVAEDRWVDFFWEVM